jgi:hypothetical protein
VPNWEGLYRVSNLSRVKSLMGWLGAEKILKQPRKAGYPSVTFWRDGKGEQWHVHRLVMKMFKENPLNLPEVDHLYGDKTDTRLDHLEYVTSSENRKRAYRLGLIKTKRGEDHWQSKINNLQALEIFNSELPVRELSKKYNISEGHIKDIKRGNKWSPITGKVYEKKLVKRLSEEVVITIFYSKGALRKIAKEFGLCHDTVRVIKKGYYHSDITKRIIAT